MEKLVQVKNVSQKIFFVFAGLTKNEPSDSGKTLKLSIFQEALKIFILSKAQMSGDHKFCIVKSSKTSEVSSDIDNLRSEIDSLDLSYCEDLESIILKILESKNSEEVSIFQIILFVGDGEVEALLNTIDSLSDVFIDFVSIGKQDKNSDLLQSLQNHLTEVTSNKSYFFRTKSPFDLFRAMSLLTAHPQQRLSQENLTHFN